MLLSTLLLLAPALRADPGPPPDAEAERWDVVSRGLVAALQSDNDGVRCSALQVLVAVGGDRVDVREARFEVVRLFRDHPDPRVRMSALAALVQIDDPWVTDFLRRTARFERDARLARLYRHAVVASEERTG
jgi:hypothetical protein